MKKLEKKFKSDFNQINTENTNFFFHVNIYSSMANFLMKNFLIFLYFDIFFDKIKYLKGNNFTNKISAEIFLNQKYLNNFFVLIYFFDKIENFETNYLEWHIP